VAERASVFEGIQVGVETTSGTGVAAGKKLQSMSIDPQADVTVDMFRPSGNKYATVAASGKDLVSAQVKGKVTYTEIVYPLSSLLGAATITGPNTDGAYTWAFNPASQSADAFKTFTVERGSAVHAEKWTYGLFSSLGLKLNRETVDLTGAMVGQALTDGITMTASPSALTLVPVLGKQISVFVDTTAAGLGTTQLGRVLQLEVSLGDKYEPLWVLDNTQSSFVATVEKAPNATSKLMVEADAAGMALLADVRAGNTKFVSIVATGPLIAGATNYSITLNLALKLSKPDPFADDDGVYAIGFNGQVAHDPTWTKALSCTVVTTLATL
jgi:hypothetical protein